jgi:hypothetical protein
VGLVTPRRRLITERPDPDGYVDKLLKLVPAEVVALWITLRGVLSSDDASVPVWLPWFAFGVLVLLTPVYLRRLAAAPPPQTQSTPTT